MHRLRHPLVLLVAVAAIFYAGVTVAGASGNDGPEHAAPPPPSAPPERSVKAVNPPGVLNLDYVAIAPCRVLDTRAKGGLMTNVERTFKVTGSLTSQGGGAACGIPASAKAVALNLTAISVGGSGYVRGRAADGPVPTTTLLNFSPALNASNAVNQPVSSAGMKLKTAGSAHLVGDVQGYYTAKIEGMIAPDGSIYNGTGRILSATHNSVGNYTVTIDRDVTYCTPTVTGYSGYVYASAYGFSANTIQVYVWYLSSGSQVAYDTYFYLSVDC